ncbi:hypothetical protein GLV81_07125 [Phnomibacter ginsenosidimutans]|uniref:Uncharacterized protein n=1 Tax=Phnomibacter ginsenosidimutans TaxID=2676868 RepID=A0A6I6GZI7_9BACT|nr:hypothetical protein GLV81_07125 [Phnomibacter ginsenosidimutans]
MVITNAAYSCGAATASIRQPISSCAALGKKARQRLATGLVFTALA